MAYCNGAMESHFIMAQCTSNAAAKDWLAYMHGGCIGIGIAIATFATFA